MVSQYKSVTRDIGFEASAKKIKRTPYDVLIVASIIEREVNRPEYRAKVARVLYNRLAKDRKLELDSTVATPRSSRPTPRRRRTAGVPVEVQHLPVQRACRRDRSARPGQGRPAGRGPAGQGKWLYFVTVNFDTGETKFANTEAEFDKIKAEFQTWCQSNPGRCDS